MVLTGHRLCGGAATTAASRTGAPCRNPETPRLGPRPLFGSLFAARLLLLWLLLFRRLLLRLLLFGRLLLRLLLFGRLLLRLLLFGRLPFGCWLWRRLR